MKAFVWLAVVAVLPGVFCPPVDPKPPAPAEEEEEVKPVQEDVVSVPAVWKGLFHHSKLGGVK